MKYAQWIVIALVGLLATIANIRVPEDPTQAIMSLAEHANAQGDSLRVLADTMNTHENRLDRHWDRMNDIEGTMAVASRVDSVLDVVRGDVAGLQSNVAGFQKVASRIKKLEGEVRESIDLSKMTKGELELFQKTFGEELSKRPVQQAKKTKANSANTKDGWWEFISQGKGTN